MRTNRFTALLCALVISASGFAQTKPTLDRTQIPAAGPSPALQVPVWTRTTLSNGATLVVAERKGLPLVSFSMTFVGGANQFEAADRRGLSSLTAAMLNEGTKTRTAAKLSDPVQLLGENLRSSIGSEEGSLEFVSTTRNFEPTLSIMSEMMLSSTFPAEAL